MEPAATGLETLVTVLTSIWNQMSTMVSTISTVPLLLISLAFVFAFGVVKISKRLMGIGGGRRKRR